MRKVSSTEEILGLIKPPIAIGFFESPPAGVPRWEGGSVTAGCVFWDKAMNGQNFYTVPSDHYNCAVGSYTHKIALPADRAHELNDTIALMADNEQASISLGCKGNRTFTGLPDEEMYVVIPGDKWEALIEKVNETHQANVAMKKYYSNRKTLLAAP